MEFLGKIIEGIKKKTPKELILQTKTCLGMVIVELQSGGKVGKPLQELSKYLVEIREILYGKDDTETKKQEIQDLSKEIMNTEILYLLIKNLEFLEFESRKDVEKIFTNLLKLNNNSKYPYVDYILENPQILEILLLWFFFTI